MSNGLRRQRVGTVVSAGADKTITIAVRWSQRDRLVGKARRRVTRFMVHDEDNTAALGDVVRVEETRPLSRHKRWRLVEVLQAGDVAELQPSEIADDAGTVEAAE